MKTITERLLDKETYKQIINLAENGHEAKRLLEDPVYQQVRENMITKIVSEWMTSRPEETEKRERLYVQFQLLSDMQTELAMFANNPNNESTG